MKSASYMPPGLLEQVCFLFLPLSISINAHLLALNSTILTAKLCGNLFRGFLSVIV
jgi:hypothetical protein